MFNQNTIKAPVRNGRCYETAVNEQANNKHAWILVHGIAFGRGGEAGGLRYPHAWLESDVNDLVWDTSLFERDLNPLVDRRVYYALGDIRWMVRYTMREVRQMTLRKGTYGPWHKRLLKLDKRLERGLKK